MPTRSPLPQPNPPPAAASLAAAAELYDRSNLTQMQLRMWIGQRLLPDAPTYDLPLSFDIAGAIDPAHFEHAFQALLDRSDALRTVIEERDGVPWQTVRPPRAAPFEQVDLSAQPDPLAAFAAWRAGRAPLLLQPGAPLFDTALVQLAPGRFIWYLNQHHVITDGWSSALLYRRLADYYERSLRGELAGAPALPAYRDYAAAERAKRRMPLSAQAQAFWQQVWAPEPEPLLLYGQASPSRASRERRLRCALGSARAQALRAQARAEDFRSLNESLALLSIFGALVVTYLYRVSGRRALTIGVLFHNRSGATRETLGLLMEVYPLRVEVGPDDTFVSLGRKVMQAVWDLMRHARQGTGERLYPMGYDALLNYPNVHFPDFHAFPTRTTWLHSGSGDGRRSLFLHLYSFGGPDDLELTFDGNEAVFDEALQRRAMDHFIHVVDQFLAEPARQIERVSLLSAAEREQVVTGFNQTRVQFPFDRGLVQLFEAQAARRPNAPAFVCGDRELTFGQLNRRANQLARYLRGLGVGPEGRVGLCLERSLEAALTLIAIFKAEGVYVPLDPTYPPDRLAAMQSDAGVSVVVTRSRYLSLLPDAAQAVCLDEHACPFGGQPSENLGGTAAPESLAYIIFTSGSTGRPKGVAVPHRQILNRLHWMWQTYPFQPGEVGCQKTALNFVDSVWELLGPLLQGYPTVILPDDLAAAPEAFVRALSESGVTRLWLVPTLLRRLLAEVPDLQTRLPRLRFWVSSGEELPADLYRQFQARLPHARLYNLYGTSEVWDVTWYEPEAGGEVLERVPIGRPIANLRAYVLDDQLQPLPIGMPGELYVAGAGLAQGYLNQPVLTAEKFVADPLSGEPGARRYRTGDLARIRPDGNLEFLGRLDHQIKIRGIRIEPGEIEAVLAQHPAVQQAVVLAREDEPGAKRLAAYLVLKPGTDDPGRLVPMLRGGLLEKLPESMVPADFVFVDALPRTPSGKIDRRALPRPAAAGQDLARDYLAPRDELERELVGIWERILQSQPVGVRDSIFDLRVDSLLTARLVIEIGRALGLRLPLAILFRAPTIEQLAGLVRRQGWQPDWSSLVGIQPRGTRPPFFCVHGIGGEVYLFRDLARHLGPEQPFYGIQAQGLDGRQPPHTQVEAMAAHYVQEIRQFQPAGPYFLGSLCNGAIGLEMAQQLRSEGQAVALLALFDSFPPAYYRRPRRQLLRRILYRLRHQPATLLTYFWDLVLLPHSGRARHVIRRLAGYTPATLAIRYAHEQAFKRYQPRAYAGRVVCFWSREYQAAHLPDYQQRWDRLVARGAEHHGVPGWHQGMLREPNVRALAGELAACLAQAQAGTQSEPQEGGPDDRPGDSEIV